MNIDFKVKDVVHKIVVKFVKAFLPTAKKTYFLRAVHQTELDIHGIASKAEFYNVATSPKVIEDGLKAGIELMYYLAADGYKIKTPLFNLQITIPGSYSGAETSLPEGKYPKARLQSSTAFRNYLKEKVKVVFDGIDNQEGYIAETKDEATGLDNIMTVGHILTIKGSGIKIGSDEEHQDKVGVFFKNAAGKLIKADAIAVNETRTLKVVVPQGLCRGAEYRIEVATQCSPSNNSHLGKKLYNIRSNFTITAA